MRLALILTAMTVVGAASPAPSAVSGEDIFAGVSAWEASDYDGAIRILRGLDHAGLSEAERKVAFKYLGASLLSAQLREEALTAFTRLLELEPDHELDASIFAPHVAAALEEARRNLAVEALRNGETGVAIQLLEKSLELEPDHPLTADYLVLARAKLAEEVPEEAPEPPEPVPLIEDVKPDGYAIGRLVEGQRIYVDRDFSYARIPADYHGMLSIQTANNDKSSDASVSFVLNRPATVFVARDTRVKGPPPTWLNTLKPTGRQVTTLEPGDKPKVVTYDIYSKRYEPGVVQLGNNTGRNGSRWGMYAVFVGEDEPEEPSGD